MMIMGMIMGIIMGIIMGVKSKSFIIHLKFLISSTLYPTFLYAALHSLSSHSKSI